MAATTTTTTERARSSTPTSSKVMGLSEGWLNYLFTQTQAKIDHKPTLLPSTISDEFSSTPILFVISVRRFIVEERFKFITNEECERSAYDVIITDGVSKAKFLLSPALNSLPDRGVLCRGCVIKISEYQVLNNEGVVPGEWFVFVKKLRVVDDSDKSQKLVDFCKDISNNNKIEFLRVFDSLDKPSIGGRGYYISMWCEDCVDGELWENPEKIEEIGEELDAEISEHHVTISWILLEEKQGIKRGLPIVGRVIKKNQLVHYAKVTSNQKYPFMFEFFIADSTSHMVKVVVWNARCRDYFSQLTLDDVVVLQNYRVKWLNKEDVEIAINSSNPRGTIYKLKKNSTLLTKTNFPFLKFHFILSNQYNGLPDYCEFDVIGVVTFVGREEREKDHENKEKKSVGYRMFRWIKIQDSKTLQSIPVKVYTLGKMNQFSNIQPQQIIVITYVKIESFLVDSFSPRTIFLHTTTLSQLFTVPKNFVDNLEDIMQSDDIFSTLSVNDNVLSTLDWFQDSFMKIQDVIAQEQREDLNTFYIRSPTFSLYRQIFPDSQHILLQEIPSIQSEMVLYERVSLFTQGYICLMKVYTGNDKEQKLPRKRKISSSVSSFENSVAMEISNLTKNATMGTVIPIHSQLQLLPNNKENMLQNQVSILDHIIQFFPLNTFDSNEVLSLKNELSSKYIIISDDSIDVDEEVLKNSVLGLLSRQSWLSNTRLIFTIEYTMIGPETFECSITSCFPVQ